MNSILIYKKYIFITQEKYKKNNTLTLKKTLENNYEKMLYCADLLEKVRKYANTVKEVAFQIQGQVGQAHEDKNQIKDRFEGVQGIQRKVRKGKLGDAMAQSFINGQWSESDRYYLFYLRIQIIQKMQRQICLLKLDQSKLSEYTKCLQQFIFQAQRSILKMREQIPSWTSSFPAKSLLGLINKHSSQLSRCFTQQQSKSTIFQLLFEFKLSTLKNKYKKDHSISYFHQYFLELGTIISLYKKLKIREHSHPDESQEPTISQNRLKQIYKNCTDQIKQQLASIFIFKENNGQIVFKCELYETLIRDQQFQSIMQEFYQQVGQGRGGDVENPVTFIKQLWHDYFINLIDMLIDQTNPLTRLNSLKQHMHPHDKIPPELQPYLHDHSLQQSLHIISQFSKKLQLLQRNLCPIVKKCTKQEQKDLQNKFNNKIHELADQCFKYLETIGSAANGNANGNANASGQQQGWDQDQLYFRKFLLLRILVAMIEMLANKFNVEFGLAFDHKYISHKLGVQHPQKIWASFRPKNGRDQFVSETLIKFDCFFIGYAEGVSQQIKVVVISVISQITLSVLTYVQQQVTGKEKDMLTHTVQSLKQKKEKVTILDKIGVPYIAKNIFQCIMKPIQIQKQFYERHFIRKPEKKTVTKTVQNSIDDFEIGEKQEKQELVRVNNIGKSLMSLGNNLITGFMKKK